VSQHSYLVTAFSLLLCATANAQNIRTPHEQRMPGKVLASITVHDAAECANRCSDAIDRQLSEASEPFLKNLKDSRLRISKKLFDDTGVTLDELQEMGAGQLTAAAIKVPETTTAVVMMIDFDSQILMERVVQRLSKAIVASNFTLSESTIGSTPVSIFKRQGEYRELAICLHDSVLCMSTNAKTMEVLIENWDAAPRPTPPAYTTVVKNCHDAERKPMLTWYVAPVDFLKQMILDEEGENTDFSQFLLSLIPRLGLEQLKAVGGSFDVDCKDFATITRVQIVLNEDQPTSGFMNMAQLKAGKLAPPNWVSSHTQSYLSFHWDLQKFFEGANQLLEMIEGKDALYEYVRRLDAMTHGLDIKQHVFDQLTGQVTMTTRQHRDKTHLLVAARLVDPSRAIEILGKLFPDNGDVEKTRTPAGEPMFQVPLEGSTIFLTVIGDTLFGSASQHVTLHASTPSDQSLCEEASFQRVAGFLSDECLLQTFDATDRTLMAPYQYLRNETTPDQALGIDFSLLPSYEALKPQLGPSAAFAVENEAGLQFTYFSLYGNTAEKQNAITTARSSKQE